MNFGFNFSFSLHPQDMASNYHFRVNELPNQPYEPVNFFSVLSEDADFHEEVASALDQTFYYSCRSDDILPLLEAVEQAGAEFFALEASKDDNSIVWTSNKPGSYLITVSEHAFSHHAYAGRYLRFKKHIAPIGSPKYGVKFSATVSMTQEKYSKDIAALVSSVFKNSYVTILSDRAIDLMEAPVSDFRRIEGKILRTKIFSHSDLTPLCVSSISEEDLTVFCEYLSLLHLNAFPNYSNTHVSNTTRYEHGLPSGETEVPQSLYLTTVFKCSPLLFNILQNNTKALSVQATTNSSSYLSYHRGKDYYSMEFTRPTR